MAGELPERGHVLRGNVAVDLVAEILSGRQIDRQIAFHLRAGGDVLPEIVEAEDIFDRLAGRRGQPQFLRELLLLLQGVVQAYDGQGNQIGIVVVEHPEFAIGRDRCNRLAAEFRVDFDRGAAGLLAVEVIAIDRDLSVDRPEGLARQQRGARLAVVVGRRRQHRAHGRRAAVAVALAVVADEIDRGDVARLEQQFAAQAPAVVAVELLAVNGVGDDPVGGGAEAREAQRRAARIQHRRSGGLQANVVERAVAGRGRQG